MQKNKSTFALFYSNRNLMPSPLHVKAREEMEGILKQNGYGSLSLDVNATKNGAITTKFEGQLFNKFLRENKGKYDGVILSLPNFALCPSWGILLYQRPLKQTNLLV